MPFGLEYLAAGGGAAASAGGGAAAGLGMMSMMGPIGIGLGIAGFGLQLFSAMEQNDAIDAHNQAVAKAAYSQMGAIDTNITNTRLSFLDRTEVAGEQARSALAKSQNGLGFTSGISLNEFIAQKMTDTSLDQYARANALKQYEAQAGWEKSNIAANASAGMQAGVSPLLAGLQGGIQGAQMGFSLGGAIDSWQRSSQINDALKMLTPLAQSGDSTSLARIQAISAGVPPQQAMNGDLYIRPFLINNELQQLQLGTARANYGTSLERLNIIQQQNNIVQDSLLKYMR